jgi:integrase
VSEHWSWSVGTRRRARVKAYERGDKGGVVYLIWSEGGQQRQECLGRKVRNDQGRVVKEVERWAMDRARTKHEELLAVAAGFVTAGPVVETGGLTISEAIRLIQDPYEGKYPTDSAHRREVLRSLRFAERCWGGSRTWTSIRKRDLRALGRRKIDELVNRGKRGARTAEKVLEHVIAVASWLRDYEHIPDTACLPSGKWTAELYDDWRTRTGSDRDYQVHKPRHTRDEAQAIMAAAPQVDPRFDLLLSLGADLRLGQVVRARRSQLDLVANTFTVYGRHTKKGTTVELTPGQRRAVEDAIRGHLSRLEGSCADYHLFPGRFATSAGEFTKADGGHVHKQTLYRWFKRAEEIARVEHRAARSAYGIRRVAVDELLRLRVSLPALQNNGGWSSPAIPTEEYADQESHAARHEAAQARATWRGEAPAAPPNPALP